MKRHTILILIKGLGIGGAEKLLSSGAQFWDRQDFEYQVAYLLPWKDQLVGELQSLGIQTHQIGGSRGRSSRSLMGLRRLVKRIRADLVHAHLPMTGVLARLASPVPVVYTEHNMVDSYRQPTRVLNRLTYKLNRLVIAVSNEVASSVSGYGVQNLITIPNGVSAEVSQNEIRAVREGLRLQPDDTLVVHVGNIRPHKGHDTLIKAASHLLRVRPQVRLVSIGGEKYTGDLDRLRKAALAAGVSDQLAFLGRRRDALAFLAAADVVVNPSDFEGLPVALLEAMALARPIVATRVGGVVGIIRDGDTGLLVEQRDAKGLASAITRVLDDPARAKSMGDSARRLVEAQYGLQRMVSATEDAYREILSR
jgi:glycosyltransferase involved in cell wall biosynthesis